MEAAIQVRQEDGVATIVFNRPERLNALNDQMLAELAAALAELEEDPECRVVVLTGAGRAFCAGQDLAEYQAKGPEADIAAHLRQHYVPVIRTLAYFSKPTLAMVNGVAAGAGMSLALAADLMTAATEARLVQAFVGIGLVPDSGSSYFLSHRLGTARALELTLLGEPLDAATAHHWGLVNRVAPAAELAATTMALARKLAAGPPLALTMTKTLIRQLDAQALEHALDREAVAQARAAQTADHRRALEAFLHKSPPPRFIGR